MKERLKKLLNIPSTSDNTLLLFHHIMKQINIKGISVVVDEPGNLLITKGVSDIYPCATAHLDTVHSWGDIGIVEKDGVFSSPIGVGGDDKCGVFICLELLRELPILKVAFFQGEEVGCKGSKGVDLRWFDDCGYILGIDRRGHSDFITTYFGDDAVSKTFRKTIHPVLKEWKYKAASGTITDSFKLFDRKVGVSCCNMSCGYHDPHSTGEYVVAEQVIRTYFMCVDLIKILGYNKYPHLPPVKQSYTTPVAWTEICPVCKEKIYVSSGWCWSCQKVTTKGVKEKVCPRCNTPATGNYCWTCRQTLDQAAATKLRGSYLKQKSGDLGFKSKCIKCTWTFMPPDNAHCINCPDNAAQKLLSFDVGGEVPPMCSKCQFYGDREENCSTCPIYGQRELWEMNNVAKRVHGTQPQLPAPKVGGEDLLLKKKCHICGSGLNNHGYCGKCKVSRVEDVKKAIKIFTKCANCDKDAHWYMYCMSCDKQQAAQRIAKNINGEIECGLCDKLFKIEELTITKHGLYCAGCNKSMSETN